MWKFTWRAAHSSLFVLYWTNRALTKSRSDFRNSCTTVLVAYDNAMQPKEYNTVSSSS
jgi:hypothetical protein